MRDNEDLGLEMRSQPGIFHSAEKLSARRFRFVAVGFHHDVAKKFDAFTGIHQKYLLLVLGCELDDVLAHGRE